MGANGRELVGLRWGLIPSWSKDAKTAYKLINARAETVAEKPAFRSAFKSRRCLLPADGFYEWRTLGKAKQPYLFRPRDRQPFAFAGLWEHWQPPTVADLWGSAEPPAPIESCTIITTTANELVGEIHDRMPVMLPQSAWQQWLDHADESLLRQYPATAMESAPA